MQILARQLGTGRVMGVDVSWKFVQQSRARFPHLTFERIDVLEDTALWQASLRLQNSGKWEDEKAAVTASCGRG